jgi:hypothetical protein
MRFVLLALLGLALVGVVACAPPTGQQPTPAPLPTLPSAQVTADQVAQSMQDDQFFSDFGDTTLLIQGTVAAVEQQGSDNRLRLATSLPIDVVCDTGTQSPAVHVGEIIIIKSANPRRDASRHGSSVLLNNCSLP